MLLNHLNLNEISSTDKTTLSQIDQSFSDQTDFLKNIFTFLLDHISDAIGGNSDLILEKLNQEYPNIDSTFFNFEDKTITLWNKLDVKTKVLIANQTDTISNNFMQSVNITPFINQINQYSAFVPEIASNINLLKTELPLMLKQGFKNSIDSQILNQFKENDIDFSLSQYYTVDYDKESLLFPNNDSIKEIQYNQNYADTVGEGENFNQEIDYQDNFKFTAQKSNVQLNFKDILGSVKVDVLDSNFQELSSQTVSAKKSIIINNLNSKNDYYLRFSSNTNSNTPFLSYYNFNMSDVNTSTDNTNTSVVDKIKVTQFAFSQNGSLNNKNLTDEYSFKLSKNAKLSFTLSQLNANADLILIDSKNKVVASSKKTAKTTDKISKSLSAGSYTLQVVRNNSESSDTKYKLAISTTTKNALAQAEPPKLDISQETISAFNNEITNTNRLNLNLDQKSILVAMNTSSFIHLSSSYNTNTLV